MRDFLSGGHATSDTMEYHRKWGYLARLFFLGVNRENGTMQHLPAHGGLFDQPARVMSVFEVMQGCFMEHINKLAERR